MKKNLLIVIVSVIVLVSLVLLTAFTIGNPDTNTNEVKPIDASDLDESEPMNESVYVEVEAKIDEKPSAEVSSAHQQVVQSKKVEETENSFDKVKTISVQGRKITANFVERQEMENPNFHARNVYKNNDGVTLDYDAITGKLLCMNASFPILSEKGEKITEQQAISIAEDFIKTHASHLDLKKYKLVECSYYEEFKSYDVDYSWIYAGYATKDNIKVSVTENGQIYFFCANPYIFDKVERKSINEQALLKQLDTLVYKYRKDIISYEVTNQIIGVNKDNDMIMCYAVAIKFEMPHANISNSTNKRENTAVSESKQETTFYTEGVIFEIIIS